MNNSSSSTAGESENCENCSSSFTLFKRKKICNLCKQAFCQACVNRQTFSSVLNNRNGSSQTNSSSNSSSSERICVICQMICAPQTSVDDLMKLKLKHLRSILNTANVATSTCKEKRDLVDLVLRNRFKFQQNRTSPPTSSSSSSFQVPPSSQQNNQPPPSSSSQPPPSSQQSSSFNDTFTNFMNNVQDFVNFNLNSALNQPQPAPAPPSASTSNNAKKTFTQSSTNFNLNGQPTSTASSSNTSSSSSTQMPSSSSSTSNLNSIFNLIGEQVPNVLQQTFNNNRFTFNNVFNNANTNNSERRGSNSSNASNTRQTTPPPPQSSASTQQFQSNPTPPPPTTNETTNESTEPTPTTSVPKRRASLSDIKSESDIENLNVKQIKEILAINFVDYKGCCEKKELVEKAKRLYNSYENNKRLEKELYNNETSNVNNTNKSGATSTTSEMSSLNSTTNASTLSSSSETTSSKKPLVDESDLCKICMESLIDCVLLDCGHMVSCTKCGKRLAECPICNNFKIQKNILLS